MVNVCREAYPPVERGTDESVELSAHPTPNPPSKPTPPTVTNPHPESLLRFPSSTLPSLPTASLSFSRPFSTPPRATLCVCRCALSHVEENPMKRGEKRASLKNRGSMNGEILPALKSEISLHILLYYHYTWYWFRESWNLSKERISVDGTFFR